MSVLTAFEQNDLDRFGTLMDEHWKVKREMSRKMSNGSFDELYERAKKAGALGGKILGAGGGGFFLVYCAEGAQDAVRREFKKVGMREIPIRVDASGTQVMLNHPRMLNTI